MKMCLRHLNAVSAGLSILIWLSLFACCTRSESLRSARDERQPSYTRSNLTNASVALAIALKRLDDASDLNHAKFRIDMRRTDAGWRVEFIHIPEAPDHISV